VTLILVALVLAAVAGLAGCAIMVARSADAGFGLFVLACFLAGTAIYAAALLLAAESSSYVI